MLFEVKQTDPATSLCVSALLFGLTLVAVFAPARRAATVDLVVTLRHD